MRASRSERAVGLLSFAAACAVALVVAFLLAARASPWWSFAHVTAATLVLAVLASAHALSQGRPWPWWTGGRR